MNTYVVLLTDTEPPAVVTPKLAAPSPFEAAKETRRKHPALKDRELGIVSLARMTTWEGRWAK